MRYLLGLAVLTLAMPAFAQQNEAEKLYRGFEKKLAGAKTGYKLWYEQKMYHRLIDMRKMGSNGELLATNDNKIKLTFAGWEGYGAGASKKFSGKVISDGQQMVGYWGSDDPRGGNGVLVPKQFAPDLKTYLPQVGLYNAWMFAMKFDFSRFEKSQVKITAEQFKLSDFRLATSDKASDVNRQWIEYSIAVAGEKVPVKCQLSIDVESNMAVERKVQSNAVSALAKVEESYTNWQIDPPFRDDEFKLWQQVNNR